MPTHKQQRRRALELFIFRLLLVVTVVIFALVLIRWWATQPSDHGRGQEGSSMTRFGAVAIPSFAISSCSDVIVAC
jgi:hypothetical protein